MTVEKKLLLTWHVADSLTQVWLSVLRSFHMQGWQGGLKWHVSFARWYSGALFLQFSIHLPWITYSPVTSFLDPWIHGYLYNAMLEASGAACPYRRETSTTLPRFVPYISLSCLTGPRTMHLYIYYNFLLASQRLLPCWHCWLVPYSPKVSQYFMSLPLDTHTVVFGPVRTKASLNTIHSLIIWDQGLSFFRSFVILSVPRLGKGIWW